MARNGGFTGLLYCAVIVAASLQGADGSRACNCSEDRVCACQKPVKVDRGDLQVEGVVNIHFQYLSPPDPGRLQVRMAMQGHESTTRQALHEFTQCVRLKNYPTQIDMCMNMHDVIVDFDPHTHAPLWLHASVELEFKLRDKKVYREYVGEIVMKMNL